MTPQSTIHIERKEAGQLFFLRLLDNQMIGYVYMNVFIAGPRPQLPIEGPWRQASLKSFLKNVDAGKEETGKAATSPRLLSDF